MAGDLLGGPDFYNITDLFKVECVKHHPPLPSYTEYTAHCYYSVATCWPETNWSLQGLLGLPLEQTLPDLSTY